MSYRNYADIDVIQELLWQTGELRKFLVKKKVYDEYHDLVEFFDKALDYSGCVIDRDLRNLKSEN